jgi:hypothetical protein
MSTTRLERATAIHLVFAVVAGIAAFAVAAIGGQPALGLAFLGIMPVEVVVSRSPGWRRSSASRT